MFKAKFYIVPIVMAVMVLAIAPAGSVYAIEGSTNKLQNTQNRVQQNVEYKCDIVTERVDMLTARYQNNKDGYQQRYQEIATKISDALARLEAKGYDVSTVKADLAVFNQKLMKFSTDFAQFQNMLGGTKGYACGNSNGDFLGELQRSREQLRVVRQDSLELRSYYQTTLRPAIQDLKDQVVSSYSN